jgi:ribose transport system ATP-binding protein
MNDLVSKGASILLISSDSEELLGMCDRILVLSGGTIAHVLDRASATKELLLDLASAS